MSLLDNLKSIFKGKFRDLLSKNKFTLFDFSKNTTYVIEAKNNEKISIDLEKASEEEKKLIKEKLIDVSIHEKDEAFLLEKSGYKTNQIKNSLPLEEDEELLKFYKDKLNPDMFKALEASIIVKNSFKRGEDITELKRDISWKYPSFGNNICNLLSEGYFNSYFKELYENMLPQEDFNIIDYQQEMEHIIGALPYMIFISKYKSDKDFKHELDLKLERLKKYGTEKLKIHGISKHNVETILRIIEEYKEYPNIEIDKKVNTQKNIITITFKFKK